MNTRQAHSNETGPSFAQCFEALTGFTPLPWQEAVYASFCEGDFSRPLSLPTGLGKTSVIHLWLLALAFNPAQVPRRLIYVVNRRTIVDQATREAEKLRTILTDPESLLTDSSLLAALHVIRESLRSLCAAPSDTPLAVSTLRGQFADNGEWLIDPARPAIILGTIDMIGSRLLFSAYGRGFKSRPLHAGLLGQSAFCVHDEAHLEPPFQDLLESIQFFQKHRDFYPVQVMPLTATPRGERQPLGLTDSDLRNEVVQKRLTARKRIELYEVGNGKDLTGKVLELALAYRDSGRAVLIFLRKPKDVRCVTAALPAGAVKQLTGTQRGLERDDLVRTPIFQRFLPPTSRNKEIAPPEGTVYLVSTSAGEVGVDISADDLISDLAPFDSMAQRLGRVNRYGNGDSRVAIVHPVDFDPDVAYDVRRGKTLTLLRRLNGDGSPKALGDLPQGECREAFSPAPTTVPLSDILVDSWAMTSIRERLPGRPPVTDWLHGVEGWEPPETFVGWRTEVDVLTESLLETYTPVEVLDDYPLKPHELLRDKSDRVLGELKKMAAARPEALVWVATPGNEVRIMRLDRVCDEEEDVLNDKILILPPSLGGLRDGTLDATSALASDVADSWFVDEQRQQKRRVREWSEDPVPAPPNGMRLVRTIDTQVDEESESSELVSDEMGEASIGEPDPAAPQKRYWHWYVMPRSADDDGSRFARSQMGLAEHLDAAERNAKSIVTALQLPPEESEAVVLAAKWHDLGKRRMVWQRSIGNRAYWDDPPIVLAKSGVRMRALELGAYRHEFGSLLDLQNPSTVPDFARLADSTKDLVLHLIAAHHGRARPLFPESETFDPERSEHAARAAAAAVSDRFARLQRRYGHWGLAYLESLVRAADALASGAGQ